MLSSLLSQRNEWHIAKRKRPIKSVYRSSKHLASIQASKVEIQKAMQCLRNKKCRKIDPCVDHMTLRLLKGKDVSLLLHREAAQLWDRVSLEDVGTNRLHDVGVCDDGV